MNFEDCKDSFEKMVCDPITIELTERLKISDSILDIISLNENQHSDLMAWMFDAREGHGQGDAILNDLLSYASDKAKERNGLDGRSETSKFFEEWTPARIRTTSFASSFTLREMNIQSGRLDLFVIDPQNEFVLILENKAGTKNTAEQLNRYREAVTEKLRSHSLLRDYDRAYIAMDQFMGDDEATSAYWLEIDYKWMEAGAKRADLQVQRGNAAASLIMTYCRQHTEWENKEEEEITQLASQLTQLYPEVVKEILDLSHQTNKKWIETSANITNEELLRFVFQNRSLIKKLKEVKGFTDIQLMLKKKNPTINADQTRAKPASLDFLPSSCRSMQQDGIWGIYFRVRKEKHGDTPSFRLLLVYNANGFPNEKECQNIRNLLSGKYKALNKHSESTRRRIPIRTGLKRDVSIAEAILEEEKKINEIMQSMESIQF